jgi:hypothetical protein
MREPAAPVLVEPSRCLHHAVERQVVENNDFSYLTSPSANSVLLLVKVA